MKNFNQDYVPATLEEAINYLYSELDKKDIGYIKNNQPFTIHFHLGRSIRNAWSLEDQTTRLALDINKKYKLSHIDDFSGMIFTGLWAKVRGLDVKKELKKAATGYLKHWEKEEDKE